jgi:hypothetical protein
VAGGWRNLRSKELDDFYSRPNKIMMSKSKRVRWTSIVASMERGEFV